MKSGPLLKKSVNVRTEKRECKKCTFSKERCEHENRKKTMKRGPLLKNSVNVRTGKRVCEK